jgi:hypothetical protein
VFALQAGCANSRWSIQMPPKKANKGAFGKGNQGYGLRNAAVDAADEPDAAGPEAQGEVCCARTICPLFVQGTSGLRIRLN